MTAPNRNVYVRPNGLRDYQLIDVKLSVGRYLKLSVLIRDDDDYPFMYYPVFDTVSKIMLTDDLPELICTDILISELNGIYGTVSQFRK